MAKIPPKPTCVQFAQVRLATDQYKLTHAKITLNWQLWGKNTQQKLDKKP